MKRSTFFRLLICLVASLAGATGLSAQNLAAVRERMEKRLPAINDLKQRQVVGENNRGLLEARGSMPASDEKLISEENADRRQVYLALAAQTGASADEVGRQRAGQLASLARRGHWIQDPNGTWRQK
ncbi:MAG: YdbL family protein [Verrucomicrobia bacterium]|nr:YdbL family protein [Verrucomicrobiota bacterium]